MRNLSSLIVLAALALPTVQAETKILTISGIINFNSNQPWSNPIFSDIDGTRFSYSLQVNTAQADQYPEFPTYGLYDGRAPEFTLNGLDFVAPASSLSQFSLNLNGASFYVEGRFFTNNWSAHGLDFVAGISNGFVILLEGPTSIFSSDSLAELDTLSADDFTATYVNIQAQDGFNSINLTGVVDSISYGTAIPEPSSYAALVGGLGLGLAVVRRRRK